MNPVIVKNRAVTKFPYDKFLPRTLEINLPKMILQPLGGNLRFLFVMKLASNDVNPLLISKGIIRPYTFAKPSRVKLKLTAKLVSAV